MYVLTEEQLEKICLELVKKSKQIYPFMYSYLIVYYELGLRFNELRYDNLYLINENTLVVKALKRSNDRYYNIADLPEPLKTFAQNKTIAKQEVVLLQAILAKKLKKKQEKK